MAFLYDESNKVTNEEVSDGALHHIEQVIPIHMIKIYTLAFQGGKGEGF